MTGGPRILYAREPSLDVAEFQRVLVESGFGATRPIGDEPRLRAMLAATDLILTTRLDRPGRPLVGVARCLTDFAWCCYLSELAVAAPAQRLGIGKGLLDEARRQLGPARQLDPGFRVRGRRLFYERAGMARLPDAFCYRRER